MEEDQIDSLIQSLKYLKKCIKHYEWLHNKMLSTEDKKTRSRVYAQMMFSKYDLTNQERRVWHKMQEFEVSLNPVEFHVWPMQKYQLWTPN